MSGMVNIVHSVSEQIVPNAAFYPMCDLRSVAKSRLSISRAVVGESVRLSALPLFRPLELPRQIPSQYLGQQSQWRKASH